MVKHCLANRKQRRAGPALLSANRKLTHASNARWVELKIFSVRISKLRIEWDLDSIRGSLFPAFPRLSQGGHCLTAYNHEPPLSILWLLEFLVKLLFEWLF